jgi:hypothetical protein
MEKHVWENNRENEKKNLLGCIVVLAPVLLGVPGIGNAAPIVYPAFEAFATINGEAM